LDFARALEGNVSDRINPAGDDLVKQWIRMNHIETTQANYDSLAFFGHPPRCRVCDKRMVIEAGGELVYCPEHGGYEEQQEEDNA
jgi:hypothetical protein